MNIQTLTESSPGLFAHAKEDIWLLYLLAGVIVLTQLMSCQTPMETIVHFMSTISKRHVKPYM